jgi:hypothetical protein
MAPAAQYRETLLTITTTKAAVVIGALDSTNNAKEVFPTPKATPTHQCTSMFKWPSATPDIIPGLRFPIPQIQGIIPGMRRAPQGTISLHRHFHIHLPHRMMQRHVQRLKPLLQSQLHHPATQHTPTSRRLVSSIQNQSYRIPRSRHSTRTHYNIPI